jgi:hypothetical protein
MTCLCSKLTIPGISEPYVSCSWHPLLAVCVLCDWTFLIKPKQFQHFFYLFHPVVHIQNLKIHLKYLILNNCHHPQIFGNLHNRRHQWFPTGVPRYPGVPRTLPRGTARCRNKK